MLGGSRTGTPDKCGTSSISVALRETIGSSELIIKAGHFHILVDAVMVTDAMADSWRASHRLKDNNCTRCPPCQCWVWPSLALYACCARLAGSTEFGSRRVQTLDDRGAGNNNG